MDLLDSVELSVNNVKKDGRFLLEGINKICPKQAEKICPDINDPTSCRDDLGLPFVGELRLAISYVNFEQGFQQKIREARNELEFLVSHTFGLAADLEKFNALLWAIMMMSIALSIMCVLIVAGIGFGVPQIAAFLRRSCVYPLFSMMILFSFVLAVSFLMMSLVAADTCYDDPGPKIAAMVESSYAGGSSEMVEDIMLRIFEGCQEPSAPLKENIDRLRDDILFFEEFSANLEAFEPHRVKHCGASQWTHSRVDLAINNRVNDHLCTASEELMEFGDFFTCRFWYPVYFKAVHESMCKDGTDGLAVIATTQIIVVFMALVVMTYRAALLDIEVSTTPSKTLKKPNALSGKPMKSSGTLVTLTDESGSSDGDSGSDRGPSAPVIIAIDSIEPQSREVQPLVMPSIDYPDVEVRSIGKEERAESNLLLISRDVVTQENVSQRSIIINENPKKAPPTTTPMIGMTILESIELDAHGNSSVSSIDKPTCLRQISTVSELSDNSSDCDNDSITLKDLIKPGYIVADDRMQSIDEEAVVSDTDIKFTPATEKDNCSVEMSLDGASLHSLSSADTTPVSTRSLLSFGDIEKSRRKRLQKSDSRSSIQSAPPCLQERKSHGPQAEDFDESVTPVLVETKIRGSFRRGSSVTLSIPEYTDEQSHTQDSLSAASSARQLVAELSFAALTGESDDGTEDVEAGILPDQSLRAPQPPVDMDDYDTAQDKAQRPVDMDDDSVAQDNAPEPLYYDMTPDAPHEEVSAITPSQILALEKDTNPKQRRSKPKQRLSESEQPFDEIPMTRAHPSVHSSDIDKTIADTEALMKKTEALLSKKKDKRKFLSRDGSVSSNKSAPAAPLSRPGPIQKQVSLTLSEGGAGDIEVQNFMSK